MSTLTTSNLTVTWEAGTSADCAATTYEILTSNCGSCLPNMTTRDSSVTCKDLVAGQMCTVSVRSMLECGVFSNITVLKGIAGNF